MHPKNQIFDHYLVNQKTTISLIQFMILHADSVLTVLVLRFKGQKVKIFLKDFPKHIRSNSLVSGYLVYCGLA